MIKRSLSEKLLALFKSFPIVSLTGPRQSGKTTLVRSLFKGMKYVSLEDTDEREYAQKDPRGFLADMPDGSIIDEAQRVPELFSYIQTESDRRHKHGQFILTGSQNFLLMEKTAQSLAGRTAVLTLLPLSLTELGSDSRLPARHEEILFKGLYPSIYDRKPPVYDWYSGYVQTYLEKDIRQLKNVSDLDQFRTFLRMCAGRNGQVLNLSALGHDCGITHNTAKSWISLLRTSHILFLLQPYHKNFNKRLTKAPKLYFYDPGLVAHLIGIEEAGQIKTHPLKGPLFESLIVSEFVKARFNRGREPNCSYWRENHGREIDCIIEKTSGPVAVEIKSGRTISGDWFDGLAYWRKAIRKSDADCVLVYGGQESRKRVEAKVMPWNRCGEII